MKTLAIDPMEFQKYLPEDTVDERRKKCFFSLEPDKLKDFISKSLSWAEHFYEFSYLNPNNYQLPFGAFPHLLAVSALDKIVGTGQSTFENLKNFHKLKQDWLFGFLTYDLKNEVENLKSSNPDRIKMPSAFFFQPKHLIFFKEDGVEIHSVEDPALIYKDINLQLEDNLSLKNETIISHNISKEAYIKNVTKIQESILKGDFYEMNYCMEFFAENIHLNPIKIYKTLNSLSPAPFSTFIKTDGKYLISASPERFLKKHGQQLLSQPIKGTAPRGLNEWEDNLYKAELFRSEKERAENMMIVDLVRNDLAKSSLSGSVKVEELFGIYTFPQVHQMISTVSSMLHENIHFIDAIKNAFPMGSMTGAPKIKVMETIEELEKSKRGLYSGASGYIDPQSNFDFNVVIRSILYNQAEGKISFHTGSAITFDSVPELEYRECVLKANAMINTLKGS